MPDPESLTHRTAALARLRRIAHLLDNAIPLPGVGYRIGLDPILGLLPGGGDLLSGLISVYIVLEGARLGVPAATLGRMGWNILLEVVTGTVPLFGDLFDVAWKANVKNVALLERHIHNPEPSSRADKLFAVILIVALLALIFGLVWASLWIVRWVLQV